MDVFQVVLNFINSHEALSGLVLLAVIASMPERLPSPFDRVAVLAWSWAWFHDSLKILVSLRGAKLPPPPSGSAPAVEGK